MAGGEGGGGLGGSALGGEEGDGGGLSTDCGGGAGSVDEVGLQASDVTGNDWLFYDDK